MTSAVIITTDDILEIVDMPEEDKVLELLQTTVGGLIEAVTLEPGIVMWVNEEGLIRGLPVNRLASLMHSNGREAITVITGDVIITGMDQKGETRGLPIEEAGKLAAMTLTGGQRT